MNLPQQGGGSGDQIGCVAGRFRQGRRYSRGIMGLVVAEWARLLPKLKCLCSWLGLSPENRISGGKVLKAKTRKVVNQVSTAFRLAAYSLNHSKTKLGDFCRRMKGRLGKAEGITAAAPRIVFAMITTGQPYAESKAFPPFTENSLQTLAKTRK